MFIETLESIAQHFYIWCSGFYMLFDCYCFVILVNIFCTFQMALFYWNSTLDVLECISRFFCRYLSISTGQILDAVGLQVYVTGSYRQVISNEVLFFIFQVIITLKMLILLLVVICTVEFRLESDMGTTFHPHPAYKHFFLSPPYPHIASPCPHSIPASFVPIPAPAISVLSLSSSKPLHKLIIIFT